MVDPGQGVVGAGAAAPGLDARHAGGSRRGGWGPEVVLGVGAVGSVVVVGVLVAGDATAAVLVGELLWVLGWVLSVAAAAVVRWRRPDHPLGPWFAVLASAGPVSGALDTTLRALDPTGAVAFSAVTTISGVVGLLGALAALHVVSRLPDGQVSGRAHALVLRAAWAAVPALLLVTAAVPTVLVPWYMDLPVLPNPLRVPGVVLSVDAGHSLVGLLQGVPVLAAVVLLGLRYRRLAGPKRRAVRWLLVPLVVVVVGMASNVLLRDTQQALINVVFILIQPMLAGAIAMAMLAPARLDADRVLRRSLVYGLLWLVIAAVYVGVASVLGVTAGRRLPTEWAVTLTVVATLAFQPARRALERAADRWVFGSRSDPARVVARLGAALADTVELPELLPQMARTLEEGLGLSWARVRLDGPEPDDAAVLAVPVLLGTEQVGVVECGPREGGLPLTDDDRAVVETFARQAALAVHNVRLASQLQAQAAELSASRTRLVRAQESERRRIERNIHDGVQQDLVALIGQAGLMRRSATEAGDGGHTDDLSAQLEALQSGLRRVLGDLRELAAGIHPSLLSDRGLLAAVEALATRHPVPVTLRADPDLRGLRMPPEVEGAGYFTVAEALANSLKHARASQVSVTLARTNGSLQVTVDDDGVGFAAAGGDPEGQGLTSLAERVAALGGRLEVDSAPGRGTTVAATMAVAPAVAP